MDFATIIGFVAALGIIIGAMYHQTHGHLMGFYSTEGVLLVIVGSACATMMSMPMKNFLATFRVLGKCIFYKEVPLTQALMQLVDFAAVAAAFVVPAGCRHHCHKTKKDACCPPASGSGPGARNPILLPPANVPVNPGAAVPGPSNFPPPNDPLINPGAAPSTPSSSSGI